MQMRSVLYSDLPGWDAASRGQTGLENAELIELAQVSLLWDFGGLS